jgi:hypothetical protein
LKMDEINFINANNDVLSLKTSKNDVFSYLAIFGERIKLIKS